MPLDNARNFSKVNVSGGYDSSAITIALPPGQTLKLPTPPFNAVWFDSTNFPDPADDPRVEIVRITNITGSHLHIHRAQEGTTATPKNNAASLYKLIAGLTAKVILFDLIHGNGTPGSIPRYNAANILENSQLTDDGTTVAVNNKFKISSTGNLIRINDVPYSWPATQGGPITLLTNDGSGNLIWQSVASLTQWNDIQDPNGDLSLTMGSYTTQLAWGSATGSNDLFELTDFIGNTGTGCLFKLATGFGSSLKPFCVSAGISTAIIVDPSGNVGIGAAPGAFNLDVTGTVNISAGLDVGTSAQFQVDNSGNIINLNNVPYSWPTIQGGVNYVLRNDGFGNLFWGVNVASSVAWSSLSDPISNLAINMGAFTSTFNWNATTGVSDLFNYTDTIGNTGTGRLVNIATAVGSSLRPFRVAASGVEAILIDQNGKVGIGTSPGAFKLDILGDAQVTGNLSVSTSNSSSLNIKSNSELVTIASAAFTDSSANLVPANSFIVCVTYRVVTVIPTAVTFDIGVPSDTDAYGDDISTVSGVVSSSFKKIIPFLPTIQSSASKIRITPNATPGTATGQVRVTVFYIDVNEPVS